MWLNENEARTINVISAHALSIPRHSTKHGEHAQILYRSVLHPLLLKFWKGSIFDEWAPFLAILARVSSATENNVSLLVHVSKLHS